MDSVVKSLPNTSAYTIIGLERYGQEEGFSLSPSAFTAVKLRPKACKHMIVQLQWVEDDVFMEVCKVLRRAKGMQSLELYFHKCYDLSCDALNRLVETVKHSSLRELIPVGHHPNENNFHMLSKLVKKSCSRIKKFSIRIDGGGIGPNTKPIDMKPFFKNLSRSRPEKISFNFDGLHPLKNFSVKPLANQVRRAGSYLRDFTLLSIRYHPECVRTLIKELSQCKSLKSLNMNVTELKLEQLVNCFEEGFKDLTYLMFNGIGSEDVTGLLAKLRKRKIAIEKVFLDLEKVDEEILTNISKLGSKELGTLKNWGYFGGDILTISLPLYLKVLFSVVLNTSQ